MGRITKLLLNIVFLNFLLFSHSLSFKVASQNLEYALYKGEKLVWSFKINNFIQEDNGNFKGEGIYILNKEKGVEIWADKGFYIKNEDKFLLKANVRLVTSEYGEIITDELTFYPKKNLILTDKEVLLIKKGFKIKGIGLIYNIDTGNFKITEKAQVNLKL